MNIETKKNIRFHIMAVLLIIIFCIAITPKTFQNDTFYTIKIGEYILENGVTMQEPFSWHQNLQYTFPHWAYDVFIYSMYNIGGFLGIYISTIVLASILGILLYFVNIKFSKNKIISFIFSIIALYLLKDYICARAQLVTFILFVLTIYFIEQFLDTKKIKYAIGLIIIPILIANLHTATFYFYFILYLPYIAELGIYILSYCNVIISESVMQSIKNKIIKYGETEELTLKLQKAESKYNRLKANQDKKMDNPYKINIRYRANTKILIVIFIICLLTGFLTPIGTTPYTYLIKTMQGISTKNISEHIPVVLANHKDLLITLIVLVSLISFTKIKTNISDLFMVTGLTLLAILSQRQSSMVYLIGSIILVKWLSNWLEECNNGNFIKKLESISSKLIGIIIISVLIISFSIYKFKNKKDAEYVNEKIYPVQAAEWIKENLNIEQIKLYNEYNYGSYLLYRDIPVFIDSRADLYLPEFNKDVYVFRDFLNLNGWHLADMEQKIEEYGFTHFIVLKNTALKKYLDIYSDKYKKIYPTGDISDESFTIYEKI